MIMHPSSGHGVLAKTFPTEYLGTGAISIHELTLALFHFLVTTDLSLICLSEHLQSDRESYACSKGLSKREGVGMEKVTLARKIFLAF